MNTDPSEIPYFLRPNDPPPGMMAPPAPTQMAPVNPTHAMTAPLGPTHDAMQGMMQAATGIAGAPSMAGEAKPAPKAMAAKPNPLQDQEDKAQSKLMADYAKDADPWGSPDNHPGFLGKLGHLGSQFVANAQHVEGKLTPREQEEQTLGKNIQTLEADKSKQGLEGAQTGHLNEETTEMPGKTQSEEALQGATTGNLKAETAEKQQALDMGPSLATAYAHRVNEVLRGGGDPATDPITQHLADALQGIQKQSNTPPGTKTVQLEIGGKPHQVLIDERTGQQIRDLGESGEKPPSVNLNLGREEKNDLLKAYQPTLDSAERMNVMTESYEKAVKDHDQQAMLNLLANHLGMTMGLQKGARMTKDIINEAQKSQPWLAGMAAKFDKDGYLAGVTLSPPQMRQMVALGQERYAEDAKKSRATAQYLGAKDDGPQRIPGKATINYYLGQTGGDPAKAKALAAQDGWSVQ